ncbi:MAG: DUF47 family protein [Candidatus Aenigmarchaeota archaeon]|nr:DUF47 family protein [Candidatus Aenigmarchaeota archaeon]
MVLDWLAPKEGKFFSMLKEHADIVLKGSEEFRLLLNDYGKRDISERKKIIKEMERRCDEIARNVNDSLNKTFITPLDREDIHELATLLDSLMDMINELAEMISLYRMKHITGDTKRLSMTARECIKEVNSCISKLEKFRDFKEHFEAIHDLERKGDSIYAESIAALFNDSTEAVEVIKLKAVYDRLESMIDRCKEISHVIENIAMKNA